MPIPWLESEKVGFPPREIALSEPNGLLAAGGALSIEWLIQAYAKGIFPWYEPGHPILWWTPNPRLILIPGAFRVSRSLKKLIRNHKYRILFDNNFSEVIYQCGRVRRESAGTWITPEMESAYIDLHNSGYAHSVEVWSEGALVGGLYGVALGKVFFGESMFSVENNTSKLALFYLTLELKKQGFELIDCQIHSDHLSTLGAVNISRKEFNEKLDELIAITEGNVGKWKTNLSDLSCIDG
ncbi:MAG: leucyl/phenylalanyl-tRNA--protein transferase [Gammaproteobacteria bacterium]|nr:leucyl/phenylalanyl-tRNA--protein transferase [Gammaproteobacteria bacterium]